MHAGNGGMFYTTNTESTFVLENVDITYAEGNTVSIVGTDGTVYVEGTSQYTVTVENWSDSADTSSASTVSAWEEYAVEKPAQLG